MEYKEHKENRKRRKESAKNGKHAITKENSKFKKIVKINFILFIIGFMCLLFLLYGPFNGFRDWLITVAERSMTHQWIAHIFYSDETIAEVMRNNRIEEIDEATDTASIIINKEDEEESEDPEEEIIEEIQYENEYEKQILAKNLDKKEYDIYEEGDGYRIINIKGKGYTGLLAAVYDPSKIKTITTNRLGVTGQYLTDMAEQNGAVLAINGGRFNDKAGKGNGASPRGITYSNGKCVSSFKYTKTGGIIGFNEDDILVFSLTATEKQAEKLNIRDCVCCGPFLIVNGKSSRVIGNGGWGTAPRTVIGQRKDGIVLFLVVDGRLPGRQGAGMNDLIDIMENYGAYNAANLDGGTSSAMVLNGKVINDPVDASGTHRTRAIATAFALIND